MTEHLSGRSSATVALVTRLVRSVLLIVLAWAAAVASLWLVADHVRTATGVAASQDLFATVLEREKRRMLQIARDYAWWDDSIVKVLHDLDPAWADSNLGGYLQEGFGVGFSLVLDGRGRPLYGARDGARMERPSAAALGTGFETLRARALAAPRTPRPAGAAGFVRLDGVPAVVAVMPFVPEGTDGPAVPVPDTVLIVGRALDAPWLAEFAEDFHLSGLRLLPARTEPASDAVLSLETLDGVPLATAAWTPLVPGERLNAVVIATMAALSLGMLALLWVFLGRARGLSRRIAADESERFAQAQALAHSEQRLRMVMAGAPVALVVSDAEGRVALAEGREAPAIAPPDGGSPVGRPLHEAYGHLRGLEGLVAETVGGGDSHGVVSVSVRDGTRAYEAACAPVPGGAGAPNDAVVVVLTDVTERENAAEALRHTLDELTRSNAELERFAYVASHDLQEPVRSMVAYAQLVRRRYATAIDDDGRTFLEYIELGALRMRDLVQGLLAYSRLSHAAATRPAEPFAAGKALAAAVQNLAGAIAETGASVQADGPLPEVLVEPMELTQVFQNLLGNALKFHRPGRPPTVRVSAGPAAESGWWTLTVEDDGIGVPAEATEEIFVLFKRLHGPAQSPGSGVGLAICQRIVERRGGRIWVTARPGGGSRFHFTVPGVPAGGDGAAVQDHEDPMPEGTAPV